MFVLYNELHPEYTADKKYFNYIQLFLKDILQAVVLIYELQTGVWNEIPTDLLATQQLLVIFTNTCKVDTSSNSSIELKRINYNLTYLEMSLS